MRRHPPAVHIPVDLIAKIDQSLQALDETRTALALVTAERADLSVRRGAHKSVSAAFDDADRLLREATTAARRGPYVSWRRWRGRLSTLDVAKQRHLFSELDVFGGLGQGSIRVTDTGMSGPAIGDLQVGESCVAGTPASYGLDMDRALAGLTQAPRALPPRRTSDTLSSAA